MTTYIMNQVWLISGDGVLVDDLHCPVETSRPSDGAVVVVVNSWTTGRE